MDCCVTPSTSQIRASCGPTSTVTTRCCGPTATAEITRGVWHLLELVAVGNTAGNMDGSVDWWLDGVHVGSYAVQWQTGATFWSRIHGTTIWGGTGQIVPALQWVEWDHMYISGKN